MTDDAPEPSARPAQDGCSVAPGEAVPATTPEAVAALTAAVIAAARRLAEDAAHRTPPPAFMDARQAARFLAISPKVLRALVRARRIPVVKLSAKTWLFRGGALVEALGRLEVPARRAG